MSLVGKTLGKYRVVEQVGRGGMGTVYRAVDETLHRDVALKILNAELNDPGVGRRFRAEAVAIARLNHPGIATIFELFQHDGQWLMAIEFVRGRTLEDLVTQSGPVATERAVDLVSQALAALGHAHGMGVVHRDLKPANLMLGDSGRLKVMDFGIARVAGTEHLTSAGFLVGTPAYMAPEQVLGQEIDPRTDLYAMGCVLFYLVTGKLPFPGTTPLELAEARIKRTPTLLRVERPDLPVWLEQVLERALAREPVNRHQSAEAFRDALRRGIGATTSTTQPSFNLPVVGETMLPGSVPVSSQIGWPPTAPPPTDELGTAETQLLRSDTPLPQARSATAAPLIAPTVLSVPTPTAAPTVLTPPTPPAAPTVLTAPAAPATPAVPKAPAAAKAPAAPAAAAGSRTVWAGLAALTLIVILGAWWFRPSAPEPAPTPPPVAEAPPPAVASPPEPPTAPPVTPVTTPPDTLPVTTPPATPVTATTGTTGTTGTPAPSRGRSAPEVPAVFDGVRLLKVTGRRGEDFDAQLRFANGIIVITPVKSDFDPTSLPYEDLKRATFAREPNPKWVTDSTPPLAGPPANLDVPGIGVRSRRWLVLQATTWFAILTLPDDSFDQILNTVEVRTRVKIEGRMPSKD